MIVRWGKWPSLIHVLPVIFILDWIGPFCGYLVVCFGGGFH